jgi:uncharacterized protein (TIGR02646 family)
MDKPAILVEKQEEWTKTLLDKARAGEEPSQTERSRYRHADIKNALIAETFGKCAYCESYLLHIAFGDVEHIHPKSKSIDNLLRWENLTLACDKCNTFKGQSEDIIDPYYDEPAEYFAFCGPMIVALPASERGLYSERTLQLNRLELVERRMERIKNLRDQLMILVNAKDDKLRNVLRTDMLKNETGMNKEFTAISRSFIASMIGSSGE